MSYGFRVAKFGSSYAMLYHSSITNPLVLLGYRGVSWGIAGVSLECCSVWNIVVLEYRWSITGYTDHWILLDITLDITGILQMCSPIQRATHLTIRHNPSQSVLQFVRQRMRKMYGQGVVLWCQWEGFGESWLAGSFDVQRHSVAGAQSLKPQSKRAGAQHIT